ncbi:prolipoprotein diacylglyceryl transferase [Methylopila turkensis]|uniref:Phosphatidylglycerol--prolipoprotein diacylglyceryl transferase n=1 Tax=Methylopila turkensis TaxID=1437816 RepID=A0A9W6JMQ6_9HYPH|nr:prolipoprotein diacylglyceryl transferase [Methylopila turkensis]GLK79236.1 prolipoprotein diacylglyceryl transferase [Methylopila turkensis]
MPLFAIPFPMIDPVLVSVGPIAIRWYALAYVAGLLIGWWFAKRLAGNDALWGVVRRPAPEQIDDLILYVAFGVVLGGRIGYVLFYNPGYYLENPIEALQVWRGGMSFHGGLVGASLGVALFARARGLPAMPIFDLASAVAPIGLFFGRLANFINGELYGRVTDVSWAMVFPHGGPEPRHPSQLYQAALEGLALFILVQVLVRSGALKRAGLVGGAFLVGYAVCRIIGEEFREPDAQIGFLPGGFTMGMALSAPMLALGLVVIVLALKRPRPA